MNILSGFASLRKKPAALFSSTLCAAIATLVLYSSLVTGCGNSTAYDPETEYANACADASIATYAKISRNLTAIVNDNPDLQWENGVIGSRVLVVAWVTAGIASHYAEGQEVEFKYDLLTRQEKNIFWSSGSHQTIFCDTVLTLK